MTAHPLSHYARQVRPSLPSYAFNAVPSRLAWLALHVSIIVGGLYALSRGIGGPWVAPLWSLVIGHSFAGCAFVGHETLHGAVVRERTVRHLIGWLCFLPFSLSPRLWVAWHNKVHHGNTMIDGIDPDSFPSLQTYNTSRSARIADYLTFGRGHWAGTFTLLLGFTGQSLQMLLRWTRKTDALTSGERWLIALESMLSWSVWAAVGFFLGGHVFLFGFVIPLMLGNLIVISYILTNHSLSPLNDINDPLLNSLSVEVPAIVNKLHLNFGLHVEHHLFPSMSSEYAPFVRDALREKFPERYQSMPVMKALGQLMRTPRVYETQTLLVDPRTGFRAETIKPGAGPLDADVVPSAVVAEKGARAA